MYFPQLNPFYSLDINACSKDKIKHKIVSTPKKLYYVLNYNNLGLSFNDTNTLKYRSVVFSFPEKIPLSFSPPKSLPWEYFTQKHSIITDTTLKTTPFVYMNEYIEGIMIHLFYDYRIQSWEIATHGAVGGKYGYYGNLSKNAFENKYHTYFHEMFLDAFRMNSATLDINSIPFLEYLHKDLCYIFILQHPKNKILLNVARPVLYLIRIYYMYSNGVEFISPKHYENWCIFRNMIGVVEFPKRHEFNSIAEIEAFFDSESLTRNTKIIPGIVITHEITGEKSVVHNKHYDEMKKNKNIQSLVKYQYLCYRRMGQVNEYLASFPKHKKMFYAVEQKYEDFITIVHQCYINHYVKKCKAVDGATKYDTKYSSHIYLIHKEIYLPQLREKKRQGTRASVTRNMVSDYFDKMEPREMLYLLCWDERELSAL